MRNNTAKVVAKNFSWLMLNKFINVAGGVLISVVVTRYLGAAQNGIMNYTTAYVALFGTLATFGMQDIVTKRFAESRENAGKIAGTTIFISFAGSCLAFMLAVVGARIFAKSEYFPYIVIQSAAFFSYPLLIFQYWLLASSRAKNYSIVHNVAYIVCLILKLVCVLAKCSLIYFVILTALETLLSHIMLIVAYKMSDVKFGKIRVEKEIVIEIIRKCAPLIFSTIAITIYMKCDQLMIGSMLGERDLGVFSVAVRLVEYWYFFPGIIYTSMLPLLTRKSQENRIEFMQLLQILSDILAIIGYFAIIGFKVFAQPIVSFLYGEEFISAAPIMVVYIWAGLFVCLGNVKQAYCIIYEHSKIQLICTICGAVVNIVLNALLIPTMGAVGAALATVVTQAFNTCVSCLVFKETRVLFKIEINSLLVIFRLKDFLRKFRDVFMKIK